MLLMTFSAFSQTTILSDNKDTLICFNAAESKFMLKKVYEVDKYKALDSLCETQRGLLDSVIKHKDEIISSKSKIIRNDIEMIDLKDEQIEDGAKRLTKCENEKKAQKLYKWIAIIVGSTTTITALFIH